MLLLLLLSMLLLLLSMLCFSYYLQKMMMPENCKETKQPKNCSWVPGVWRAWVGAERLGRMVVKEMRA